jgi:hypothetical protein
MKRIINSLNSATSETDGVRIKRLEAGMGDWRAYEEFARTAARLVAWIVTGIVGAACLIGMVAILYSAMVTQ